jgi:hypothetical protein
MGWSSLGIPGADGSAIANVVGQIPRLATQGTLDSIDQAGVPAVQKSCEEVHHKRYKIGWNVVLLIIAASTLGNRSHLQV